MKTLLIITAAALLLVGCATSSVHHNEQWEYKIARSPSQEFSQSNPVSQAQAAQALEDRRKTKEAFLNDMGKDGWILVERDDSGAYYFKRVKR